MQAEQGKKDIEQEKQRNQLYWLIFSILAGFVSVIIILFLIFRSRKKLQNAQNALSETLQETQLQKAKIEKINQDLHDSIRVAERIQNALLPSLELLKTHFENSFLLYMPRDVVSGDFYWFAERKNTRILVVADCTGHGVPGALVSMMGMQLLDKIVNENRILEPHRILQILDWELVKLLKKKENQVKEGMDMAIIALQKMENFTRMEFAGAMNPIYLIQNGELQDIKANKKAIGGSEESKVFESKTFELTEKTNIYLFSDGYQDQFGGEKNKKFMVGNFKKLLVEIAEKPMPKQGEILEKTIQNWITVANEKQTDDITVFGLRV